MRFFSDIIEFTDEAKFWIKLYQHSWKKYFLALYFKKDRWKQKRKLFDFELSSFFLDKLFFNIAPMMNRRHPVKFCPIPEGPLPFYEAASQSIKYISHVNSNWPEFFERLNNYLNKNYILSFYLSDQSLGKNFNIKKDDIFLYIKFEDGNIHHEVLSTDFTLSDFSAYNTISVNKINTLIKNIRYDIVYDYIYENILNDIYVQLDDYISEDIVRKQLKYKKINFDMPAYIRSYSRLFCYDYEFYLYYLNVDHDQQYVDTQ